MKYKFNVLSQLALVGAMFTTTVASADAVLTVEATGASVEAGVKGYECSIESGAGGAEWTCQVVGKRGVAGWVSVATVAGGVAVTAQPAQGTQPLTATILEGGEFKVTRGDQVLAHIKPMFVNPTSGLPIVGEVQCDANLQSDAAWALLMRVFGDPGVGQVLVGPPVDISALCDEQCGLQYPMPGDCLGAWDEYICCVRQAEYDHCRRVCACASLPSPQDEACVAIASAIYVRDGLACAAHYLFF